MTLSIQLNDDQVTQLNVLARELGVDVQELARAAVVDLLNRPSDDFERAARQVLEKNRELYRRLG